MIYAIISLIFISVLFFGVALMGSISNRQKITDKLKIYDERPIERVSHDVSKKKRDSIIRKISKMIPNFLIGKKFSTKISQELVKADIQITVKELLLIKLIFTTQFIVLVFLLTKDIFLVFLVGAIIWNVPKILIHIKKVKRLKEFDEQINEGIMIITNSLKAGYSFLQAVGVVVEETADPFAKEFKKLLKEMSLGVSIEDALKNLLNRMESEDLELIVNAILIQKDIGGNLSEILDNIGSTIRERQKIYNELKTLTAQGKLSGLVVILIPAVLALALYVLNKEYIMLLFTTNVGLMMVGMSVVSQIIGVIIINNIVKIDM
jgi:tight adherence protein B